MTYATGLYDDLLPSGRLRTSRKRSFQAMPIVVALAGSALVGALILDIDPAMAPGLLRLKRPQAAQATVPPAPPSEAADAAMALAFSPTPLGSATALASSLAMAAPEAEPAVVAQTDTAEVVAESVAPLPPERPADGDSIVPSAPSVSPLVASVPLPVPRPADVVERPAPGPARLPSRLAAGGAPAAAAGPDTRSVLEKLFGIKSQPTGPALAYAAPEEGVVSRLFGSAAPVNSDRQTAVYDISAHTVFLPNGAQLEAHSGLGGMLDDPRSIAAKNRGVTPPSLYDLTLREKLFHGVRALRLTPVGNNRVFGRVGLLAHTFMLGPNGDSNGCVSFRNYNAFLQAYLNGDIRRLQVVTRRS